MPSSNPPRSNRGDVVASATSAPYPPVQPMSAGALHGPSRDQHIVLILGVGPGVGLAVAQVFAQQGYVVAIASRNKQRLDGWAQQLHTTVQAARGGQVGSAVSGTAYSRGFACDVLSPDAIRALFDDTLASWPGMKIGTAVFNASVRKRGPFLEQRPEQLHESVQASIFGSFTFMQAAIGAMQSHNDGLGGSILVTGATSSIRGREGFASFAASKGGLRQICQSVAREYMPKQIHVAHIIVDGLIDSQAARDFLGLKQGQRFADDAVLRPEEMAKSYLFLATQHRSAWTFEMDLRPAREHF